MGVEDDDDALSLRVEIGGRKEGFLKGLDLRKVREEEGKRFKASIFVGAVLRRGNSEL